MWLVQVVSSLLVGQVDYQFATTLDAAAARLDREEFDVVVLDMVLPDGSGLELLDRLAGR